MSIESHVVFWIFWDLVIAISGDLFDEGGGIYGAGIAGHTYKQNLPEEISPISIRRLAGICCDRKFTQLQTDQGYILGQADAA